MKMTAPNGDFTFPSTRAGSTYDRKIRKEEFTGQLTSRYNI